MTAVTISVPDDTCTLYVSKEAPRELSVEMDLSTITDSSLKKTLFLIPCWLQIDV